MHDSLETILHFSKTWRKRLKEGDKEDTKAYSHQKEMQDTKIDIDSAGYSLCDSPSEPILVHVPAQLGYKLLLHVQLLDMSTAKSALIYHEFCINSDNISNQPTY